MPNTELFAPIVDALQPAFIYDEHGGEVKIYFSYSSYNEWQSGDKVKVVITDPNKTSIWGDNVISTTEINVPTDSNNDKIYEISINFDDDSDLTVNQYYQVQLAIIREEKIDDEEITYTSPMSKVTLIRPIPATSAVVIEQLTNNITENPSLDKISGYVTYEDNSQYEYIKDYSFEIKDNNNTSIYDSSIVRNTLGTRFEFNLPKVYFNKDISYTLVFNYTTINGYKNSISKQFQFTGTEELDNNGPIFTARSNHSKGCIELSFDWSALPSYRQGTAPSLSFELYKSSQDDGYLNWIKLNSNTTVQTISNSDGKLIWEDYYINSGVNYKYKFVLDGKAYGGYQVGNATVKYEASMKLEDIYLADSIALIPIKYNAKVSGLKWVVQENITNTLGGVYPIIRRNADTYYRQFNLSGTLDFRVPDGVAAYDSVSNNLEDFQHVFENFTPIQLSLKEGVEYQNNIKNFELPNATAKRYIMKFLTDGQIKLFKSAQEGLMLVHLSNVSFTPNATLSREIMDFSCTITEVAPVNTETLEKYNIFNRGSYEAYVYALDIDGFYQDENGASIPYLPLERLYKGTLTLTRQKVGETYVV